MGKMTFTQVNKSVNTRGKPVYIYRRTKMDGEFFSYEVFIPYLKKAGTYPLPGEKSITYSDDMEIYPGASVFGRTAWEFRNLAATKAKFNELVTGTIETSQDIIGESDDTTGENDIELTNSDNSNLAEVVNTPKYRGRQKNERPVLQIPIGEFSTIELAKYNKVDYPAAALFIKENNNTQLKYVRSERRNSKGKETKLFQAMI